MNVIALLQMALALLSNPQVQANQVFKAQAISFANTAIQIAEESTALQAQSTPVPLVSGQDTSNNPLGIGSPDLSSVETPAVTPLSSNKDCVAFEQNSSTYTSDAQTMIGGWCASTSTQMCTYSVPDKGSIPMSCVAIQLCYFEHDCPTL